MAKKRSNLENYTIIPSELPWSDPDDFTGAGILSLWLLPNLFIKTPWLRVMNLFFSPLIAGLIMAWIGSWRRRHEKEVIRLETFAYGFCFAFAMGLIRFIFGH